MVCADSFRVWRPFRNWENQFGNGSTSAAAVSAPKRTEDVGEPVRERIGHISTVVDKRWIIYLIHQTWGSRCRTVSFPLRQTRREASQCRIGRVRSPSGDWTRRRELVPNMAVDRFAAVNQTN